MTDEQQQSTNSSAETENTGRSEQHMIPKSRFDEVNIARRDAEQRLAELEQRQADADRKRLEDEKKYQELYQQAQAELETLKPYRQQAEEIRASLQATVTAEIEALPEDMRGLVPDYDDPRKTLEWLTKNKPRLTRPIAPNTDAGARGDASKDIKLTAEEEEIIRKTGITRERYIERRQQLRRD